MTFTSTEQIKEYLLSCMKDAVIDAQEKVYKVLDEFLNKFYSSYDPSVYERMYYLLRSLVKSELISTGNGYKANVYFDYSSLHYTTGAKPSGLQVVTAAASGGHGAEGLHIEQGSVGIWDDPMRILNSDMYKILKQSLIDAGIPIK